MSELEYDVIAYFKDSDSLKKVMDVFQLIYSEHYDEALLKLQNMGFDKIISVQDLWDIKDIAVKNRLEFLFITPTHSDAGEVLAEFLGEICSAVIASGYHNGTGAEILYGYVQGKKCKFSRVIKAMGDIDQDMALYEAVNKGRTKDVKALISKGANPNTFVQIPTAILCVIYDRPKMLKTLLEAGADPNQRRLENGNTLLIESLFKDNPACLHLALDFKADPNLSNREGITPLMEAASSGRFNSLKRLIDAGADLKAHDKEGKTILMHAIQGYSIYNGEALETINFLIEKGADVTATDKDGRPAITYATSLKPEKILLNAGAYYYVPESEYNGTPEEDIFTAIQYNHKDKVVAILKEGLNPNEIINEYDQTPMDRAIDRPEIFKLLIENGVNLHHLDKNGKSYLHLAALRGSPDAAQILITNGLDPNEKDEQYGETPLHYAIEYDVANILLKNGADLSIANNRGETPLGDLTGVGYRQHFSKTVELFMQHIELEKIGDKTSIIKNAIWRRLSNILNIFFESGISLKNTDYLNIAIEFKNEEAIKLLINSGADINYKSTYFHPAGQSAFNRLCQKIACENNSETKKMYAHIYQLMIEKRADIDSPTNAGITPLFYFQTQKGFENYTIDLIDRGANINQQAEDLADYLNTYYEDATDVTPLMLAASKGLFENVKILVEAGADLTLENEEGLTALAFAEKKRKKKVATFLKEFFKKA